MAACIAIAGCTSDGAARSGPPDGTVQATADTGIIVGLVLDESITPVVGATVTVADEQLRVTSSDDEGRFVVGGLAPGVYRVDVEARGFFAAQVAATVVAGVDDPPLVRVLLSTDVGSVAYVDSFMHEGFAECSFRAVGFFVSLCAAGPILGQTACGQTGVCLGNLTDDASFVLIDIDGIPTFTQLEMVWESTQSLGDMMQLNARYATAAQVNAGGTYEGTFNSTQGPSPIFVTVSEVEATDAGLGTEFDLLGQALAAQRADVPIGATLQQRFSLFTHAFYNYAPPPDWRFTDGTGVPRPGGS